MCICYDLRFPELSQALASAGAELLTYPSAFTVTTGQAHWEALLRARAIETQCYVVAAAQSGKHGAKRSSYGHSMIVDPWGVVVAQCGEGEGVAMANIDLEYLNNIRKGAWKFYYTMWDDPLHQSCSSLNIGQMERGRGHRALELGGRRTISFWTLFSVFLDRNSICCTGMNNEKPILASEVIQDAETG